ncbi:hypothetical protein ACVV7M_004256 [Vibrio vulnificus]|uniref:hypothetical protein n=1 Tax=Vibrio vulnificus TaxID=672 RepID=UPI00076B059E|nr:hypothetical protein [Vibrio vulnificus]ELG9630576.1 hypothetical protein [Vibrio vulnificus]ELJ0843689.1 hypothetical protein [Vibrio vulnificus]ELV8679857.1 hypothetical protein [Vibrio vulnificus]MCU8177544.1 hypothetical protein [Vibrio vulnificus]MCU8229997.1 hypothetical protein [Vibrio vulnificus]
MEKDPWKNSTVTNKNKFWFYALLSALVLYVILGDKTPEQSSTSNVQIKEREVVNREPSQDSIDQCRDKISSATFYKKERLSYIGSDNGNVVIVYVNDFGKAFKFRCTGKNTQLYAEGSGSWISM